MRAANGDGGHAEPRAPRQGSPTRFQRCVAAQSIALALGLAPTLSLANDPAPEPPKHVVEFSFGQSQLFIESSSLDESDDSSSEQLPTSSALFLGEWLGGASWSTLLAFNLPLSAKRTMVNGVIHEERATPTLGVGMRWSPLSWDLWERAHLETQLASMIGTTVGSNLGDLVFPIVGGRFHLSRPDGFSLYLGSTWSFRRDTLALIYGLGHRF